MEPYKSLTRQVCEKKTPGSSHYVSTSCYNIQINEVFIHTYYQHIPRKYWAVCDMRLLLLLYSGTHFAFSKSGEIQQKPAILCIL